MPRCEVCYQNEAVGVASLPFAPCSVAYCRTCLEQYAHPEWAVRATIAINGGEQETAAWFLDGMRTYRDGRYLIIREYITVYPLTPEETEV